MRGALFFAAAVLGAGAVILMSMGEPGTRAVGFLLGLLSQGTWVRYAYLTVKLRGWPVAWSLLGLLGLLGAGILMLMPQKCLRCGAFVAELVEVEGRIVENRACQACGERCVR